MRICSVLHWCWMQTFPESLSRRKSNFVDITLSVAMDEWTHANTTSPVGRENRPATWATFQCGLAIWYLHHKILLQISNIITSILHAILAILQLNMTMHCSHTICASCICRHGLDHDYNKQQSVMIYIFFILFYGIKITNKDAARNSEFHWIWRAISRIWLELEYQRIKKNKCKCSCLLLGRPQIWNLCMKSI